MAKGVVLKIAPTLLKLNINGTFNQCQSKRKIQWISY